MSAFNAHEFTTPPDTEEVTWNWATQVWDWTVAGVLSGSGSIGPIPYCTRYAGGGSIAFLYIQTDRTLTSTGAMTTTSNYTVVGTSAPTITAVAFTTGKSHIRLELSGTIPAGQYSLQVKDSTFTDGNVFNVATSIPIFIDYAPLGTGIAETIDIGSPVMSHT